jgi:hypothetical protein
MTTNKISADYEVLSSWAEVDPVPARGVVADRPADLSGKKIGLYYMWKRASRPILTVLEKRLKTRYPTAQFSWYEESVMNTPEIESPNKLKFEDWLKGVDTVIFTYGD